MMLSEQDMINIRRKALPSEVPVKRATHVPLNVTRKWWAAVGERLDALAGTEKEA